MAMAGRRVYYQTLGPEHKSGMMEVCKECFPIDYPGNWYDKLLKKSRNVYTLGAFDNTTDKMVGMIVGQTQTIFEAEDEIGTLLESLISDNDTAVYITIFGVMESHRRLGIGTLLMDGLLSHAHGQIDSRVVFLHVESTNNTAIMFYEQRGFCYFTAIPGYYHLEGNAANAIVYVTYINGGKHYEGGLKNWCKRYVMQGSAGQCFNTFFKVYENTCEAVKNVLFERQHDDS